MKEESSIFTIIFLAILFPIVLLGVFFTTIIILLSIGVPTYTTIEREFNSNREEFDLIVGYLLDLDDERIRISRNDGNIPISDEEVAEAIGTLFQLGYRRIMKDEYRVTFSRWANRHRNIGVYYFIDEEMPKESLMEFLVEYKPLCNANWYFYVSDYIERRRQTE